MVLDCIKRDSLKKTTGTRCLIAFIVLLRYVIASFSLGEWIVSVLRRVPGAAGCVLALSFRAVVSALVLT